MDMKEVIATMKYSTPEAQKKIAIHEAGHAVMAYLRGITITYLIFAQNRRQIID
ncbi:MAG: hypothetical protein U0350_49360 [Caldilineaceae bacterium]